MAVKLNLLFLLSLLAFQARAESSGSVVFFDAPGQRYIRSHDEAKSLSPDEVAAAISVLLGFAPPVSLPVDSSLKLDEVLFPNPFDRPRAVFLLEVVGIKDPPISVAYSNGKAGSTFSSSVLGFGKADIQLTDEDEVYVLPLDEPLVVECDDACVNNELQDLAQSLGGTYGFTSESLDGELNFPLASGSSLKLNIAKKSDKHFALSLVSLVRSIRKAAEIHEDFAGSSVSPAELLIGRFTGIQALREEYNSVDIIHQGAELLQMALMNSFEVLKKSYKGKIVGVVLSNNIVSPDSGATLNVKFSARESRLLEEVGQLNLTTIEELILVRRSLAWTTGIVFLVSTLLGIYFLLYMPLTRDTLLYSNVKLD